MVVITFGVVFHDDAIKPIVCLFVVYSLQREIKESIILSIIIITTLWNIIILLYVKKSKHYQDRCVIAINFSVGTTVKSLIKDAPNHKTTSEWLTI